FFFSSRRRHTRFSRDWSSDVCSSDLSTTYPTALVDFDGNERAAIHLRNSDLNALHILLQQLKRDDLAPAVRRAASEALFSIIERNRAKWTQTLRELEEELGALHRLIERQRAIVEAQPKKW